MQACREGGMWVGEGVLSYKMGMPIHVCAQLG